jgi:tetratricopeptide (TPR) repeat protein
MSSIGGRWLLLIGMAIPCPAAAAGPCTTLDRSAADAAATLLTLGALDVADDRLRQAYIASDGCDDLALAAWSVHGWRVARDAAATGGRPGDLAPVVDAVSRLAALGSVGSPAAYAVAIVRAAAAASQDERDELTLWLDHAGALSDRLGLGGDPPRWPLPFDVAAGALWFEVDDYALAERAFRRALTARPTVLGWAGLGRALDRQARRADACEAYRSALAAASGAPAEAAVAAEVKAYLSTCAH